MKKQNGYKDMTKMKKYSYFLAFIIACSCLSACVNENNSSSSNNSTTSFSSSIWDNETGDSSSSSRYSSSSSSSSSTSVVNKEMVNVTIVESVFFEVDMDVMQVEKGQDFSTVVSFLEGYTYDSCDYTNHTIQALEKGKVLLTLKGVKRNTRVIITSKRVVEENQGFPMMNFTLHYQLNGGKIRDEENGTYKDNTSYTEKQVQNQHIRPNTWNGVGLEKDGYTLIGWNTREDGSGEHIGLGSRVTVKDGGSITLYAEWRAWMHKDFFTYKKMGESITITGYRGGSNLTPFVIPAQIEGYPVTEIASGFTTNMLCGSIDSKTLILPNTLRKIASGAFKNATFDEVYFFDNIQDVADTAFQDTIKTYHVNAYQAPVYLGLNNSVSYADSIDRLVVNADKKKMILFSGCSFTYGVQSPLVDEAYNGEYVVCNLGVNGDINAAFQMECILEYLGEGDVLVHAPEQGSKWQLMASFLTDGRMFLMAEGNYDILSIPDFTGIDFFNAFMNYSTAKSETAEKEGVCTYLDGCMDSFNQYGDYILPRSYDENTESKRDISYSNDLGYEYSFYSEFLTESGVAKLAGYYDQAKAKGAKVCISYAPMNESTQLKEGTIRSKGLEFDQKWKEMLAPYGYAPISDFNDYIFEGRYFYDADYHMNDLGALFRTKQLIEDLRKAGI